MLVVKIGNWYFTGECRGKIYCSPNKEDAFVFITDEEKAHAARIAKVTNGTVVSVQEEVTK